MKLYQLFYRHVGENEVFSTSFRASDYDQAVDLATVWLSNTEGFLGKKLQFISVSLA